MTENRTPPVSVLCLPSHNLPGLIVFLGGPASVDLIPSRLRIFLWVPGEGNLNVMFLIYRNTYFNFFGSFIPVHGHWSVKVFNIF